MNAGLARRVAGRGQHGVGTEGAGGAEDGTDIVRVGDLVEDDDEIAPRDFREAGARHRIDLERGALVHRLVAEQFVEVLRVGFLDRHAGDRPRLSEAIKGVGRHQQRGTFRRTGLSRAARTVCRP